MCCYLVPSLMKNKMILNMSLDFENVSTAQADWEFYAHTFN